MSSAMRASSRSRRSRHPRPSGCHEIRELFAVENHPLEDGVDECRERLTSSDRGLLGEVGDLPEPASSALNWS